MSNRNNARPALQGFKRTSEDARPIKWSLRRSCHVGRLQGNQFRSLSRYVPQLAPRKLVTRPFTVNPVHYSKRFLPCSWLPPRSRQKVRSRLVCRHLRSVAESRRTARCFCHRRPETATVCPKATRCGRFLQHSGVDRQTHGTPRALPTFWTLRHLGQGRRGATRKNAAQKVNQTQPDCAERPNVCNGLQDAGFHVLVKRLSREPENRPSILELLEHPYLMEEKHRQEASRTTAHPTSLQSLLSEIESLSPASVWKVIEALKGKP
ncbi:hypothetical protein HPB50_010514 [Hyalomma asiaticum]|uniref:Uncharacterized protein n=1 Tax=Hyalomma asiaticum TaxID=266040 RepID=A0ACB7RWI2_HYAAI|nr:hypothetical protein HPB50_010514 [Hyalomma asiaticum]